jgi:hypothetical protein
MIIAEACGGRASDTNANDISYSGRTGKEEAGGAGEVCHKKAGPVVDGDGIDSRDNRFDGSNAPTFIPVCYDMIEGTSRKGYGTNAVPIIRSRRRLRQQTGNVRTSILYRSKNSWYPQIPKLTRPKSQNSYIGKTN